MCRWARCTAGFDLSLWRLRRTPGNFCTDLRPLSSSHRGPRRVRSERLPSRCCWKGTSTGVIQGVAPPRSPRYRRLGQRGTDAMLVSRRRVTRWMRLCTSSLSAKPDLGLDRLGRTTPRIDVVVYEGGLPPGSPCMGASETFLCAEGDVGAGFRAKIFEFVQAIQKW